MQSIAAELPLVLSAEQVAEVFGWMTRTDEPRGRREKVVAMVREGRFPRPIDPKEPVHLWRWSRSDVERYAAGAWSPSPAGLTMSLRTDRGAA